MCSISSIKQKKANKYAAFYYLCRKREKKMGQKEPIELALKLLDNLKIVRHNEHRYISSDFGFVVAQMLKTTQAELESKLEAQIGELKEIKAKLEKFKEEASLGEARSFLTAAKTVGSLKVITAQRDGMDPNAMRKLGDFLRDKEPGVVGVLASVHDGKVTLLAVCGKDAVAKGVKAGDIIKAIAPICGGKGGGKPDSAMGGGTEVSKVDDALAAVDDLVLKVVG